MTVQSSKPKRKKRSLRRTIVLIFRDYMVEIVAAIFIIAAGVLYLLFSPKIETPHSVRDWLNILSQPLQAARQRLTEILAGLALPQILLGSLVVLAVFILLLRMRFRFMYSKKWNSRSCPSCGEYIQRIHRKPLDRYIAPIFLPQARRYRCPKCGWEGLRRASVHHRPS